MNEQLIKEALSAEVLEELGGIDVFEEIDSTNAEALRQIRAGSCETGKPGLKSRLILAQSQSAGRGRRGREWISPKLSGIYMSLLRPVSGDPAMMQGLSLITALSVVTALQKQGAEGLALKWPNDVLADRAKLAGILLELQQQGETPYVVFGIGINLVFPSEYRERVDRPVTDLASVAPGTADFASVVAAVVTELLANVRQFEKQGFGIFQQKWNALDSYRGRDIVIHNGTMQCAGTSQGVNSEGALVLKVEDGIQLITGGEVFPSLREQEVE